MLTTIIDKLITVIHLNFDKLIIIFETLYLSQTMLPWRQVRIVRFISTCRHGAHYLEIVK